MKKSFKTIIAMGMMAGVLVTSSVTANASTLSNRMYKNGRYYLNTMNVSTVIASTSRVNTLGLEKKKYTSGSITVDRSQTFSATASGTVATEFQAAFASVEHHMEFQLQYQNMLVLEQESM